MTDLGSSHGTRVNGTPAERVALKAFDRIAVGDTVMIFESDANELPETLGPYRVRELLGKAGQSAVYSATGPDGRAAAVKLFPSRLAVDPAAMERFHRELAALAPVSRHPNLVQCWARARRATGLYLAMELVEGTSPRPGAQAAAGLAARGLRRDAGDLPGARPRPPARLSCTAA